MQIFLKIIRGLYFSAFWCTFSQYFFHSGSNFKSYFSSDPFYLQLILVSPPTNHKPPIRVVRFLVTVLAVFNDMHVDVDLYALVFGESALNDAVAIVMASIIDTYSPATADVLDFSAILMCVGSFFYVFFISLLLGSAIGCVNALITKFTGLADFPNLETGMFILLSYVSFLLAEVVELTGIVAVLFCGICQAH